MRRDLNKSAHLGKPAPNPPVHLFSSKREIVGLLDVVDKSRLVLPQVDVE